MFRLNHFLISFLFIALSLGSSCSDSMVVTEEPGTEISGSGVLVSEHRPVSPFVSIVTAGPITTVVSQGKTSKILVTADDNVIQKVRTVVQGNTLNISLEEGSYHNIWIRVKVVLPVVSELANLGPGTLSANGLVTVEPLKAVNSGNGTMILQGSGPSLHLINKGSGSIEAFGYRAEHASVHNEGQGSCEVAATILLEGLNSGSGCIRCSGTATVTAENTGAGSIIATG